MKIELLREEEGSGRTEELAVDAEPGDTIKSLLQKAEINPQTVLVERDGAIVPHQDEVNEDDESFRILDVISGG